MNEPVTKQSPHEPALWVQGGEVVGPKPAQCTTHGNRLDNGECSACKLVIATERLRRINEGRLARATKSRWQVWK